jgi:hypothetical protein
MTVEAFYRFIDNQWQAGIAVDCVVVVSRWCTSLNGAKREAKELLEEFKEVVEDAEIEEAT